MDEKPRGGKEGESIENRARKKCKESTGEKIKGVMVGIRGNKAG